MLGTSWLVPGARVGGREVECSGYGSGPSEVSAGSKGGGRRIPAFVRRNVRLPHHIANPAHSGCDPLSSPSCSRRRCGARQPVSPPRAPPECHIETRRRRVRIRYRVERPHRRTCDGRGSSRDAEACTRRAEFSTPSEVPAQIREHTGRDERPPLGVRGDRGVRLPTLAPSCERRGSRARLRSPDRAIGPSRDHGSPPPLNPNPRSALLPHRRLASGLTHAWA